MKIRVLQKRLGRRGVLIAGKGLLGLTLVVMLANVVGAVNVLERSNNTFRTGTNTAETVLTPANVQSSANQFHKRSAGVTTPE